MCIPIFDFNEKKDIHDPLDDGFRLLELTVLSLDEPKFFFLNTGNGKRRIVQLT